MNTHQDVTIDERTVAIARAANTWGLNFISFALLIDIMYRAAVRKEAAWDLFALLGASGAISMVYMARQKVLGQVFGWKLAIIVAVGAGVVAAVTAMILSITKAM
jgi:hypothetical protein